MRYGRPAREDILDGGASRPLEHGRLEPRRIECVGEHMPVVARIGARGDVVRAVDEASVREAAAKIQPSVA